MRYNTHGAQFQISDGAASPAYTTVAQVESITLPSETRGSEDVPTHDIAAGGVVPKLVDALRTLGTMGLTIIEDWAAPSHDQTTGMYSLLSATEVTDCRIVLPDANGTQIDFPGWVTNRAPAPMPANRGAPRVTYDVTLDEAPTIT